jgi:hypothetical protein
MYSCDPWPHLTRAAVFQELEEELRDAAVPAPACLTLDDG